jgi:hypothetical protein
MKLSYQEHRAEFEAKFAEYSIVEDSLEVHHSPSGKYTLEVQKYSKGEGIWAYSRGLVKRNSDRFLVADVKRNYGAFWHAWVLHPNGHEYLLCGEDYQGYNIICLDTGENLFHYPEDAFEGTGFCWATVHPSPDGLTLAVEGCYWACPYELVFYDFSDPSTIPLLELTRIEEYFDVTGWDGNTTFHYAMGESKAERQPTVWQHLSKL